MGKTNVSRLGLSLHRKGNSLFNLAASIALPAILAFEQERNLHAAVHGGLVTRTPFSHALQFCWIEAQCLRNGCMTKGLAFLWTFIDVAKPRFIAISSNDPNIKKRQKQQADGINLSLLPESNLYTTIYKCTFNSHICRPQIDTLSNSRFKISVLDSLILFSSPRYDTRQSRMVSSLKSSLRYFNSFYQQLSSIQASWFKVLIISVIRILPTIHNRNKESFNFAS